MDRDPLEEHLDPPSPQRQMCLELEGNEQGGSSYLPHAAEGRTPQGLAAAAFKHHLALLLLPRPCDGVAGTDPGRGFGAQRTGEKSSAIHSPCPAP